ncbi:MAG: hypothetical protein COV75_07250 [Candidatus Omnitrophica bacterium CG11_big_fil_rev_8_21_14_0_20_63_9]|nr:MAG: hypothetical protein COV75_07250 [Candidatus Omnitrophica bacterium CG11_big_fil_rev_8_21_14_0_20_63_9]
MHKGPIPVLLFEDDDGQALLTKEALEADGFTVDVCRTGREGLDRLFNTGYEVYLIDMKLPDIAGVEILRRINTIRPGAVCIIVTGHGDEAAAVEAMKLGAYDYIIKSPYMGHLTALPVVIREGLARRQLKAEREQLQTELWEQARLLEERNAELRRANEELKRLDQLKSDLISMVSHELRTPLATMKEFTSILADHIAGPVTPDQQQYLAIIKANIDRLGRIIDDLLDMAKIEAGRIILTKGFVEVRPLTEHVLESLRPLAEAKQVSLELQLPQNLPGVFADEDKVNQILVNLVGNAIKYTDGPGRVTVSAVERTNELEFSVADTGIGIAPEDVPRLFEKFQQLRRVPGLSGGKGAGLGLAISKRLVELHGGRIWLTSTPGAGSTFCFSLPKYHVEEIFHECVRTGLEQAKHNHESFSLIVTSIMNFTEIKAQYGLEQASRLLKEAEGVLREAVRRGRGDIVIRWQQGEMVVILAEVDQAGAKAIADRMRRTMEERAFTLGSQTVHVTVRATSATYPDEATTWEELVQLSERRLPRPDVSKTTILIVDDEPKIRQFLKQALELREYDVLAAASGPDALEQLKRQPVDLVLLDLMMPVMDGYEVYHLLKEDPKTRDIPVIIVTAKGERKDRQLGLDNSTYNYITKPFQLEDLLAKVQEVLQQRAASR